MHHIDPADALETSGSPCLRFAIIDKHGLVEGPSDWDIEGHGLPFCGQNVRLGLPFPRLPSVQQMNESPVCIFEENVVSSVPENRFSVFFWSTLCLVPSVSNNKEYNHVNEFSVAFSHLFVIS